MQVCTAHEVPQEALQHGGGQHQMALVLTFTLEVETPVVYSCVLSLARPFGRAFGGPVQVPSSTAAPLDLLSDPTEGLTTYRRTCTNIPYRSSPFPFPPSR